MGHEVIVADPTFAPMYATPRRGVKTDRRDGRTLAEACRLGAYRRAHRASVPQRHARAEWAMREALIGTRTRYVGLVKAFVRRERLRLASGEPEHTEAKPAVLAPLRALWAPLEGARGGANARVAAVAATDPVVAQLRTAPGIGPVTAVALVATLDGVGRFRSAHQVEAYLGFTPVSPARSAAASSTSGVSVAPIHASRGSR